MPISLETSGHFFIKFWISACQAWNGCPRVGVVDASKVRQDPTQLYDDMSRPRQPSNTFGISCNPYTGKIHASLGDFSGQETIPPRSWSADVIGWQSAEDATQGDHHASIEIVILISNGTLEFIREGPHGWERSGVVWDRLPAKILCCVFLFEYVGQAIVSIEEVSPITLDHIAQTRCNKCGKLSCWTAWPSEE
jgi:hypothetical protein